jgi:transposase
MARHRSFGSQFKRQVAREFLDGRAGLHELARRYSLSRNLIRLWIRKDEDGEFNDELALLAPCQMIAPPRRPRCGSPATCIADNSSTASIVARPVTSTSSSKASSVLSTSSTSGKSPCPCFVSQRASVRLSSRLTTR